MRRKIKKEQKKPNRRKIKEENKPNRNRGKRPGPNGSINKKQRHLVKIYCNLPQEKNSRYIAYMRAGYRGSKELCDEIFESEKIQKAITKYKEQEHVISHPSTRKTTPTNNPNFGHHLPKLTEEITKKIEDNIGKGMSNANVANLVGIEPDTFYTWMRKGKEAINNEEFESPYARFVYRIKRARAAGEANLLGNIHDAAFGNAISETKEETNDEGYGKTVTKVKRHWPAAAWLLERTRPDLYGKNAKPVVEEKDATEQAQEIYEALNMLTKTVNEDEEKEEENSEDEE
jgi:hypothetical protein